MDHISAQFGLTKMHIAKLDGSLLLVKAADLCYACKSPSTLHGMFILNSCLRAIHMYSGQATLKSYLPDPSEHSIIHTSERPPPELQIIAEDGTVISEQIDKDPIRVVSERGDIELLPAARINYSKIYVVEKDVRVLNIGMVHQNSMASLMLDSPLKPQKQRDVH
jgi:hypothetical protein